MLNKVINNICLLLIIVVSAPLWIPVLIVSFIGLRALRA